MIDLEAIPADIVACAIAVQRWVREQNVNDWKLLDLCSRDTAERLEADNERLRSRLAEAEAPLREAKTLAARGGLEIVV